MRSVRRGLATSFVTTVCLSCAGSAEGPDVPAASATASGSAPPLTSVAPPPDKPRPAALVEGALSRLPNGTCRWIETVQATCPPKAACNPPEPRIISPTPCGRGSSRAALHRASGGGCEIVETYEMDCPANAKCNPPGPLVLPVACPDWMP